MTNMQVYRSGSIDTWRVSKSLSRLAIETGMTIAYTEAKAEIDATVIHGIAYVGQMAMQDVALLTQMEQQLATAVPLAASRLQAIGDMATLGMADVVAGSPRRLGRR